MKLVLIREHMGWTQVKLEKASGVSQTFISDLEKGKKNATLPTLKKLANALGVTVAQLIGEAPLDFEDPTKKSAVGE